MTHTDIRLYLKKVLRLSTLYAGFIPAGKDKVYGLYPLKTGTPKRELRGEKRYTVSSYTLLIHGTKDYDATTALTQAAYEALDAIKEPAQIAGKRLIALQLRNEAPVFVGQDERGVFEYVIDIDMIMGV